MIDSKHDHLPSTLVDTVKDTKRPPPRAHDPRELIPKFSPDSVRILDQSPSHELDQR